MSFLKEEYPELMWDGKEKLPIVVSFGAGVDSTAILVRMWKEDIKPDHILFADTGAERPDIYAHIERVNKWCDKVGFPNVTKLVYRDKNGEDYNLLQSLEKNNTMPSLAFGFKSCSIQFKIKPQRQYIESLGVDKVINIVGYGVGEIDRAIKGLESYKKELSETKEVKCKMVLSFPLIEWKLNRDDCKKLSRSIGFCTSKSACFFCPSMPLSSIVKLRDHYPELYNKSIEIERNYNKKFRAIHKERTDLAIKEFGEDWEEVDIKYFKEKNLKKPKPFNIVGLSREKSWEDRMREYDYLPPELPFMEQFGVDMGCGCTDF